MVVFPRLALVLIVVVLALPLVCPGGIPAETLPERQPAMAGSGPNSLVNVINVETLFRKGQRDAWVMFECGVRNDGFIVTTDFFTSSPDSGLLKNEVRRRLRQVRFIPAIYDHKRVPAWFAGTAMFVVAKGRPHLRLYAHQDLDEIKRGTDFVAPQLVFVPNHDISNYPPYPTAAKSAEVGAILKLRHSVDVNGTTTGVQVLSEHPPGYGLGDYVKKLLPLQDYLPGYRNGRPTAATYTFTYWFGRAIGW